MSTTYEAVLVVGADARTAYERTEITEDFMDWVCRIQDETGMTWFEDEGLFGHHDGMRSYFCDVDEFFSEDHRAHLKTLSEEIKEVFSVEAEVVVCLWKY